MKIVLWCIGVGALIWAMVSLAMYFGAWSHEPNLAKMTSEQFVDFKQDGFLRMVTVGVVLLVLATLFAVAAAVRWHKAGRLRTVAVLIYVMALVCFVCAYMLANLSFREATKSVMPLSVENSMLGLVLSLALCAFVAWAAFSSVNPPYTETSSLEPTRQHAS